MKSKIINTLIIVITLLSINIIPCHAEVKTYNRNELENYGVKKNITITKRELYNASRSSLFGLWSKSYCFGQ